jgi:signal transduction histidine kinase
MLVGTFGKGLWYLDEFEKLNPYKDMSKYPSLKYISYLYPDSDTLFIGTNDGVAIQTRNSFEVFPVMDNQAVVMAMIRWQSDILVGFYSGGLHVLRNGKFDRIDLPELERTAVNYLTIDGQNRLWVCSNKPYLLVFDSLNSTPQKVFIEGLTESNFLEFLSEEEFLLGTEGSVIKVRINADQHVIARRALSEAEGYIPGAASSGKAWLEEEAIWFATTRGVYQLRRKISKEENIEPILYIKQVLVKGSSNLNPAWFTRQSGFYRIPQDLILPYNFNEIGIAYQANDPIQGNVINYRYKLEPADKQWINATGSQQVNYASLTPNTYRFIVQAQNSLGVWSSTESFSFIVRPAFWQTTVFKVSASLLFTIAVFLIARNFYSQRIRRYKREERIKQEAAIRIREQVAMDFHDELGNKLAAIVAQANALKVKQNRNDKDFTSVLDYVENNAKQIYEGTRDFIWSIDTKSGNLQEIVFYIKDFGERLFTDTQTNFFVVQNISDQRIPITLQDGYGRHMVLFSKEALTNVYKHAKATNVWFRVFYDNGDVYIAIEDDGIGFQESYREGNGLRNLEKRANRIGGQLRRFARKPNGTIIELNFHI